MKIAVIGSGVMGSGIAQVFATKHNVVVRDVVPAALEKAKVIITKNGIKIKNNSRRYGFYSF